jgi:hypothetical protein
LHLWWDFSEADGTWNYSDLSGTVPITDGDPLRFVANRAVKFPFGGGSPEDDSATYTGTWDADIRNGNGAFNAATQAGWPWAVTLEEDGGLGSPDAALVTFVIVAQTPTITSRKRGLMGPSQSVGNQINIGATTGLSTIQNLRFNPTPASATGTGGSSMSLRAGDWYIWWFEVSADGSNVKINDQVAMDPDLDVTPGIDPVNVYGNSFRLGAGVQPNFTFPDHGWDSYIGEALFYNAELSADDKVGLFRHLNNKWSVDTF